MTEVKLNLFLMGKRDEGKSATGNTILNRKLFKIAINRVSETKDVDFSFSLFEQYLLLVVDGPGLDNPDIEKVKNMEAVIQHLRTGLSVCYGGIDAFLLVVKFGNPISAEDKAMIEDLKVLFGDAFMEHVIVVVTCGDLFQIAMEEQGAITFVDWCKKQKGELYQLYEECQGRVVLFNNRERDEVKKRDQIQRIVHFAHAIQNKFGRYTNRCFQDAELGREKLLLTLKIPQLSLDIQEKIRSLGATVDGLSQELSSSDKIKIKNSIKELNYDFKKQEQQFGSLMKRMEENADNSGKIRNLNTGVEFPRKFKKFCKYLGFVVAIAIAVFFVLILLSNLPGGSPVVVLSLLAAVFGFGVGFYFVTKKRGNFFKTHRE